jgi:hypothetical protein
MHDAVDFPAVPPVRSQRQRKVVILLLPRRGRIPDEDTVLSTEFLPGFKRDSTGVVMIPGFGHKGNDDNELQRSDFASRSPSKQWAALKYRGEVFAQVRFKPEGEPFALAFRIPRSSFQIPGVAQRLTTENLLKAVGIATDQVESWHHEGASPSDTNDGASDLGQPLPPPPQDLTHLHLCVCLKPPPQALAPTESTEPEIPEKPPEAVASQESSDPEIPEKFWQDLEGRWNAILGLEASIDTLRISLEGLRSEMEAASAKTLTPEEKVHALGADVAQWTKAKSRIHHALPKVRDFIHRSTWAAGAPERKRLEELFETQIGPRIPFPQMNQVMDQLENLLKDRQVLSSLALSVYQDCKSILEDVQRSLRNLQANAATKEAMKRSAGKPGGKFFKDVRKMSGL